MHENPFDDPLPSLNVAEYTFSQPSTPPSSSVTSSPIPLSPSAVVRRLLHALEAGNTLRRSVEDTGLPSLHAELKDALGTPGHTGSWLPGSKRGPPELKVTDETDDPSAEFLLPRRDAFDAESGVSASGNSIASENSELKRRLTIAVNKFSSRIVHGDEQERALERSHSKISILNTEEGEADVSKHGGSSIEESEDEYPSDDESQHSHPSEASNEEYTRDFTLMTYNRNLGLYGFSLRLFGPYDITRVACARLLAMTPDFVFLMLYLLYASILAFQTWNPPITNPFYFTNTFDWAEVVILVINVILSAEITAKVIAYGFYDNRQFYTEFGLEKKNSFMDNVMERFQRVRKKEAPKKGLVHSFTLRPHVTLSKAELDHVRHPFCRSGWNVIDLVSCTCYWIDLVLRALKAPVARDLQILRFMLCSRILRLCRLTEGTFTITRSLKHALPQLGNICLFLVYFWVLLSIAGVQTFKLLFQRQCVYMDPEDGSQYRNVDDYQFCGAWLDPDLGQPRPYLLSDGSEGPAIKGYYCPRKSQCIQGENPYDGTVSFDNIFHLLELVYVVMSMNTFTDLMYYSMDAENMAGLIFFIVAIFLMLIWLLNIFVAVIVSSFKITSEMVDKTVKKSLIYFPKKTSISFSSSQRVEQYLKFELVWVIVIAVDMIFQCCRKSSSSPHLLQILDFIELTITYILVLEICLRFAVYLPDWRSFIARKCNLFDLFLAISTAIITLPPVRKLLGQVYNWLTILQILRFYRVVMAVRFVRDLWLDVIGNVKTIASLTLFYFLMLFLVSIMTTLLFEGVISADQMKLEGLQFALNTLPNTFLALYVITSTENWTDILYNAQLFGHSQFSKAMGLIVLIGWFIFSNSIVLNIFIAVIAENLEVGENAKKKHQVQAFIRNLANDLSSKEEKGGVAARLKRKQVPQKETLQKLFELLMGGTIVDSFLEDEMKQQQLDEREKKREGIRYRDTRLGRKIRNWRIWHKLTAFYTDNPFFAKREEKIEDTINPNVLAKNILMEDKIMAAHKTNYLHENPSFNTVLYVFLPRNRLRRFCQMFVAPSVGERIDGRPPEKHLRELFNMVMLIGTIGIVVLACYATPLYTHSHNKGDSIWFWITSLDLAFALLFTLEAVVKILADGLIYTPNAVLRSLWNVIDMLVLITLWLSVILTLRGLGSSSRIVRGFKALRALRLLTLSETAKKTFHRIIIAGFWNIMGAASVLFCLLFPFAIWGLNIFNGRLAKCNDEDMDQAHCYGEYSTTVYDWDVVSPRSYDNPYLYFDSFPTAFSALFQISSLEGWTDLLEYMTSSTGKGTPTLAYAEPYNAIFVVVFMFLAMIFILNLFVSVIISNYLRTSGSAYLTNEQRSWKEVEKLLSQVKPSRRPRKEQLGPTKCAIYELVIEKHRVWQTIYDCFLGIQLINLLMESSGNPHGMEIARNSVFLISALFFLTNSSLRLTVKGISSLRDKWDAFQFFVSFCATVFAILLLVTDGDVVIIPNFSKAFSLLILTFVIQRSNRLSLLLKFASASLPHLLSLLYTWFIMFLVYAIALNQVFGLTKLGANGSGNRNLRTVTKSLILLFKMSFGEGWNGIMDDYFLSEPYCSLVSQFSDCGNPIYAYLLFASWNVISMYIFLNLFISLVVENFSYVYHRSGPCSLITRQEIRKFKQAWMRFDPDGTGFIPLEDLYEFLHSLNGVLSFKLYDGRLLIKNLKEEWFIMGDSGDPYDFIVDIAAMKKTLELIDVKKVRTRKLQFERFVEEAIYDMKIHGYPGISFSKLLMQIPLYTQFEDGACLSLNDYLERHLLLRELDMIISKKKRMRARETFVTRWKYLRRRAFEKQSL